MKALLPVIGHIKQCIDLGDRMISPRSAPPSRLQSGMMTFQTQRSGCPQFA